jgi:hypothetical protein
MVQKADLTRLTAAKWFKKPIGSLVGPLMLQKVELIVVGRICLKFYGH